MEANGFKLIVDDHKEVKANIQRYKDATNAEEKKNITNEIIKLISQHSSIEEQHLYPMIRNIYGEKGNALADLFLNDHTCLKHTLVLLEKMDIVKNQELHEKIMDRLKKLIDDHTSDEEMWLSDMRQKVSAEEINKLRNTLEEAKKTAPTKPHPYAPDSKCYMLFDS